MSKENIVMPSSFNLLIICLLCFSMHACHGRSLGFANQQSAGKGARSLIKVQGIENGAKDLLLDANSEEDLLKANEIMEGLRRHERSLLGSLVSEDLEVNKTVEDIVDMDYAEPHRKPPIHNEKN